MTRNRAGARNQGTSPPDDLWTYKQVAAYLQVSERTVHHYADDPDHPLERIKPGGEDSRTVRFSRAVVEALGRQKLVRDGTSGRRDQEVGSGPDSS